MKKKLILIISLVATIVIVFGVSYSLLQKDVLVNNGKIIYKVGELEVKLDESGSKDISLDNALPTEDSDGLKNEPYSFSLVNNAITDLKYTIYLEDDPDAKNKCGSDCELIPYNFIRYNLSNDSNSLKTENLSSSSTGLYTGTISSKSFNKFMLRIWLSIDANNSAMGKYYFGKLKVVVNQEDNYCIKNGFNNLSDCMLVMNKHETSVEVAKQNIASKGTPDVSKTATTDEGLFMSEDDDGPSYYYRGAVKNNYVSFAGFMWRIIRHNGDGSIRLIYSGKSPTDTGEAVSIEISRYNNKYWDPTYVGYKYNEKFSLHENNTTSGYTWFANTKKYDFGTGYSFDESTKKFALTGEIKQLDWLNNHDEIVAKNLYCCLEAECNVIYKVTGYYNDTTMIVQSISYSSNSYVDAVANNINSPIKDTIDSWYKNNLINYNSYLSDEIFCNDRSFDLGSGYLLAPITRYSSVVRLEEVNKPSLKCTNINDKFTLSNEKAKLNYPIALITADEVAMAGAVSYRPNKNYYLYTGTGQWSMTPSYFSESVSQACVWYYNSSGGLESWYFTAGFFGIRPVINLRSDVKISKGDGTALNPYQVITE